MPLWHLLFAGLLVIGTLVGLLDSELTTLELRITGAVAAAMMTIYWAFFVRRQPWSHSIGVSLLYLALMTLGWAILLRQSPSFLWLQTAIFSQVFFMLTARWAFPVILAMAVVGLQWDLSERTGPFTDHLPAIATTLSITAFLAVFGSWIGTIVHQSEERHELIKQLEAMRRDLAEQDRLAGMQAERQRLAREIHDTLAQDLIAIVMQLRAAGAATDVNEEKTRRGEAERIAQDGLAEARRIVWALRPATLESAGLVEALGRIVGDWQPEDGPRASLVVTGGPRELVSDVEVTLLRAVQEGLANIARHARARRVTVSLSYLDDLVTLDIHDDGIGFETDDVDLHRGEGGLGLRGMRERVSQVGGRVAIESMPGEGTTIGIRLPLVVS